MPAFYLEQVIEESLDKIADANLYRRGSRSRYLPLRSTGYTKVRKNIFPGQQLSHQLMKEKMFRDVRTSLIEAKSSSGSRCLATSDVERLDRAWDQYRIHTLTVPERLHTRWERLCSDCNITRGRLRREADIYWVLYPILYKPMLLGEVDTFNKNNQAFLSGFATRHHVFPFEEEGHNLVWSIYIMTAAFCHHRLNQQKERLQCIAEMKRLLRANDRPILAIELLGHWYYNNPTSSASLRGYKIVQDHGLPEAWNDWSGYDLGRAAISAIQLRHDGNKRCRDLGGATPLEALERARDIIAYNGHYVQSNFFDLQRSVPDALDGRLDRVYEHTSRVRREVEASFGKVWLIDDQTSMLRAIAHYHASVGSIADLEQARNYVDCLGPFYRSKTFGLEREMIDKIIDASDTVRMS